LSARARHYIRRQSPLADNICLILLLKHFRPVEIRFFVVLFRRILVNDTRKKQKGLEIIVKFFRLHKQDIFDLTTRKSV